MTAIVPTDILLKLSAPNANSGSSVAGYPGTSWGGWISTSLMSSSTILDNLFNDITGPQNAAGQIDYACLFIHNNTAGINSMAGLVAWLPQTGLTGTGSTIAMAADPTGITAINSNNPQALTITSAIVAPAGITTWVSPTNVTPTSPNYINGLQLGNVAPSQCVAVWFQRTALASTAPTLSSFQIELLFSTGS